MKSTYICMVVALLIAILSSSLTATADEGFSLLTIEEAKALNLDDAEWEKGAVPKSVNFGLGPRIEFESPDVQATDKGLLIVSPSTMNLLVVFKGSISPVDMETLNIKASKGWFSKNLTKRLAPYLVGTSIKAENVKIPSGRFKLEIKIGDKGGHESVQEYLCDIRKE